MTSFIYYLKFQRTCQLNHDAAGTAGGFLHRLPPRVSSDDSSGEKRDQGLEASKETLKKKHKEKDQGEKQPKKAKRGKQDKAEKQEKKRKDSGSKSSKKKKKTDEEEDDDEEMDPDHDPIREHEDDDDDDDRHDETEMASQVPKDLQVSEKVGKKPAMHTQKKPASRSGKRSCQEPRMETFFKS